MEQHVQTCLDTSRYPDTSTYIQTYPDSLLIVFVVPLLGGALAT